MTSQIKRNSFRKRIWVFASVILVFFLIEAGITYFLSREVEDYLNPLRIEQVSSANQLKSKIQKISDLLGDYAVTGDEDIKQLIMGVHKECLLLLAMLKSGVALQSGSYDTLQYLLESYLADGLKIAKALIESQPLDQEINIEVQKTFRILLDKTNEAITLEQENLLEAFQEAQQSFDKNIDLDLFKTVLIIFIGFFLIPVLIRRITHPITQLKNATDFLGRGNLDYEVSIHSNDEFEDLGNSFNFMVKKLREKTMRLEETKQALESARIKADAANKAKSNFLANMSHEIRTPMNAILGYAQILRRDQKLNSKERKAVEAIYSGGVHLLSLINNILDISKIEAGKMEQKNTDFDLISLVNDLSAMFQVRCQQANLDWQVEGLEGRKQIFLNGDEVKLRQVLINLLGNGVKFTESGKISLKVSNSTKHLYTFEVVDTGMGIPLKAQKSIFEAFQQDEAGLKKGGTGLGLAISSKHVALMGGELKLESEEGRGSCFFFSISLLPAPNSIVHKGNRFKSISRLADGFEIAALVVDDNQVNRDVLVELLSSIGVKVTEAENGQMGLDQIRKHVPEIVYMDYQMPIMDGLEVIRHIQKEFGRDSMKIVMVSAAAYQHESEKYLREGAHGFIAKPIVAEEVFETLNRLLGVEFEYGLPEGHLGNNETNAQNIDFSSLKLPKGLVSLLKNAAKNGDISEIERLFQELDQIKPNGVKLVTHLNEYIERFDTDGILSVLERVSNE